MSVATRISAVRERIAAATEAAGRAPDDVTIVGVSKTHPPEMLEAALDAELVDLGENRTDEWDAKRRALADPRVRWHFVGRVQTRAAADLVGHDVLIHSVDRRRLVDRLERLCASDGTQQRVLVQVNVGDDPAKGGCALDEVDDLVAYAVDKPHLSVEGVMTVPPLPPSHTDPNAAARPHFARLAEVADRLDLPERSMGMSADLEAAVAEGATMVRVGTAIFGPRDDGPWQHPAPTRQGARRG